MTMPRREEIHPVLLNVLRDWQGIPHAKEIVAEVTRRFPQLTNEDLAQVNKDGSGTWVNRIRWARQDLVMQGLIDKTVRGVWSLTPAGMVKANEEYPEIEPITVGVHDESAPPPQDRSDVEQLVVVPSECETLIDELVSAATDSTNPNRLEHVVADIMRFLGFDVAEIGGAGQTDVLAIAPLGPLRFRIVIDAKSTSSKRVMESQINWLAIDQHRRQELAEHAVVVGVDFAGGQLRQHAEEFGVCLLTVAEFAELIRLHVQQPLSLVELQTLFAASPRAAAAMPEIRAWAAQRVRRMRLLLFVLQQIDQFNTVAPDDVIVKAETLWAALLQMNELRGITQHDVADALRLLEIVGVIAKSNGDGYVSQTSLPGALAILSALSQVTQPEAVQQEANGLENSLKSLLA